VRLLARAEGAGPRLLGAARYLDGALLAPGFYPEDEDAEIGPFVTEFASRRGRPPGLWEALAYGACARPRGRISTSSTASAYARCAEQRDPRLVRHSEPTGCRG
jgi:hypothetical protein